MAQAGQLNALYKAFSGLGIDEKSLISNLAKSHPEVRKLFSKSRSHVELLELEPMRFKNALDLLLMQPSERDARLIRKALEQGPQSYGVIVEVACTRSSNEFLGARKAYRSLFKCSIKDDVAAHINGRKHKLLVALVSACRDEGQNVEKNTVKSEAKLLAYVIKNGGKKNTIKDEDVVRILSTRSKPHLKSIYKHYKKVSGKSINEDLEAADLILKETVECLCIPHFYFSKVLDKALKNDADENTKNGLTRVIVTRADVDMKEIKEEYNKIYGVSLSKKIEDRANGTYRDFMLSLAKREN